MKTLYLKVTYDDRFISQERVLRGDMMVAADNPSGCEQTQVEILPIVEGRPLLSRATDEALEEAAEGLRPYQNYKQGFLSGYNAAIGRGTV